MIPSTSLDSRSARTPSPVPCSTLTQSKSQLTDIGLNALGEISSYLDRPSTYIFSATNILCRCAAISGVHQKRIKEIENLLDFFIHSLSLENTKEQEELQTLKRKIKESLVNKLNPTIHFNQLSSVLSVRYYPSFRQAEQKIHTFASRARLKIANILKTVQYEQLKALKNLPVITKLPSDVRQCFSHICHQMELARIYQILETKELSHDLMKNIVISCETYMATGVLEVFGDWSSLEDIQNIGVYIKINPLRGALIQIGICKFLCYFERFEEALNIAHALPTLGRNNYRAVAHSEICKIWIGKHPNHTQLQKIREIVLSIKESSEAKPECIAQTKRYQADAVTTICRALVESENQEKRQLANEIILEANKTNNFIPMNQVFPFLISNLESHQICELFNLGASNQPE